MNATEQIKKFHEFLEQRHYAQLLEVVRKGQNFFIIDFSDLMRFDPELASELLEQPEEVLTAAELAAKEFNLPKDLKRFHIRVKNLPASQKLMIRDIRSKHLKSFFLFEGVVRQKSDVRPQVIAAKFECPSCGNVITVLQLDKKFKEPNRCSCGRKGRFKELSKELIDGQGLVLEEATEDLEGGEQPKRINVFLKNDLVSPINEKRSSPGSKIRVIGWIAEVPITLRTGGRSTKFDLLIEANYMEPIEEDFLSLEVSKEEEEQIKQLSKDPKIYQKLTQSLIPSIFGYDKIKEALILQLAGGIRKVHPDGVITRGDVHMLLIGDPGAGKSAILKRIQKIAPKGRYIAGKGISAAGLTASVVRDEFLGGWSLEAGALVLANLGVCCTTEDSEFILENGQKMTFKELFTSAKQAIIYPKFKIMALNLNNLKIEPFKVKKALKIKNKNRIYKIKTRSGRELTLTEDNEIFVCRDSQLVWQNVSTITKGDYLAVPKCYNLNIKDTKSQDFAYAAGLIASDGHIKIDKKNAQTSFYNSDKHLIDIFKEKMKKNKFNFNTRIQKKGRESIIRKKKVTTKKNVYVVYNSQKKFAQKLIDFGIPSGNKSTQFPLNPKLLTYSNSTLASFLKGIFDGDGSIRFNPIEITLTTGIKKNAQLYQEMLLRLGITSAIKKSTNSWHCDIRGANECLKFYDKIGTCHFKKLDRMASIRTVEVKSRIDVLPNHQLFFKNILKKHYWKLGKKLFKYFWYYTKNNVTPSKYKLNKLNTLLNDPYLNKQINSDILWDKIVSIKLVKSDYVYDFTMEKTNNFIANNIIMHNCIDELDKMTKEDRSAMHEALENQTVSISKANIQATLRAETTVLAAANPKFGRFDPYDILVKQIDLPPTLINRFDLIFPIKDLPDKVKDKKMATHILSLHQEPTIQEAEIPSPLLKKYIAYARQKITPKITDQALSEIRDYYLEMRGRGESEEGIKTIPITPRQLEALVRLAEASAKIRLSKKVLKKDAKKAIALLEYCLSQVARDSETGQIDIDRITTGVTASQRNKIMIVKEIIAELENKIGKTIPLDDIITEANKKGLEDAEVDEVIERLKRSGDLFSPRPAFVSRI